MKNNFVISLCGIRFLIKCQTSELYNEQIKVFQKMISLDCLDAESEDSDFVITYSKNEKAFEKIYCCIKSQPNQLIKPYMNESMFKGRTARFGAFVRESKDFIALQRDDNHYSVISNPRNKSSKNALYTVMLEILQKELELQRINLFHSTGFKLDDMGLLVIGQSKCGKTTLFSKLAQCSDIEFLSNDRVLCNDTKMMAFPLEIILSLGTVKHDSYLKRFFIDKKKTENWFGRTLDATKDNEKCGIKPYELREIYPNIQLIQEANINCIVLPKINLENKEILRTCLLSNEKARDIILDCNFTLEDKECRRYDWIYPSKLTDMEKFENAKELVDGLLKKVPVLAVEFGCNCTGVAIKQALNEKFLMRGEGE